MSHELSSEAMPTYDLIRGSETVPGLALSVAFAKLLQDAQWLETTSNCHPLERSLGYVVPATNDTDAINVILCLGCFSFKILVEDTTYGPGSNTTDKTCVRCNEKKSEGLFISREGFPTKFCDTCRYAWGKAKFQAEKEAKKSEFKQEMAEAAVTTTERLKRLADALAEETE